MTQPQESDPSPMPAEHRAETEAETETEGSQPPADETDTRQGPAKPPPKPVTSTTVLFIADIVGKSGVYCVKSALPGLKERFGVDLTIANAEAATGGFGLGKSHAIYLHKLGVDVITGGECIYYKRDMVPHISNAGYILRPANYPYDNPGRGWLTRQLSDNRTVAVVNVLGQAMFRRVHLRNPFELLPRLVERIRQETPLIVVDFHAASTGEKATMFYHLDGAVSAAIGTHVRTQSADERIMPKGTAMITHAGRTGSLDSVGGLDPGVELRKLTSQVHEFSDIAWDRLELQGVVVTIDPEGRAEKIERVRVPCETPPEEVREAPPQTGASRRRRRN